MSARVGRYRGDRGPGRYRRRAPLYVHHPLWVRWTAEMDALLGTATDADVAQELGIGARSVWKRRVKLGVSAHGGSRRRLARWKNGNGYIFLSLGDDHSMAAMA